jgi:hypothetical protein
MPTNANPQIAIKSLLFIVVLPLRLERIYYGLPVPALALSKGSRAVKGTPCRKMRGSWSQKHTKFNDSSTGATM